VSIENDHSSLSIPQRANPSCPRLHQIYESITNSFGEHENTITDPIAAKDLARLEAALETLRRMAMG